MHGLRRLVGRLLRALLCIYLLFALVMFLKAAIRLLKACLGPKPPTPPERTGEPTGTAYVPPHVIRQADPLVYSQQWLIQQGLAVTWQNPDFRLERADSPGTPVSPSNLDPATDYRVMVSVWNGATSAPAVGVGVQLSYIDFGIGGVSVPIGNTAVDLPVKGAAGTPAVANVPWTTPATPGHYCLQALLVWPPDADPGNNLGQHNVDVKPFNSPTATFAVPVRNTARRPAVIRLAVDAYELPVQEPCPPERDDPEERRARVRAEHAPDRHRLPDEWQVDIEGDDEGVHLAPGEERSVTVTLTAPDGFAGRQAINLQGWDGNRLIGGVTLVAEGVTT